MPRQTGDVTFIHTADWQIGKPFAGCDDETKRHMLQAERIAAVERIGALARERGAAFVVVAGDLFDTPAVTKATVSGAMSAIGGIGLPVYAIPGNHDHAGPGSIWAQEFFRAERESLAPNFTLLAEATPFDRPDARLYPCPLLARRAAVDPTRWLHSPEAAPDPADTRPRIVIAHGSAHGFSSDGIDEDDAEARPAEALDLSRIPGTFDYLALGDWHGLKQVDTRAWYPGAPEPDRFGKGDDPREGYALVVTARRGAAPAVEPVRVGRTGWHELALDLTGDESLRRFDETVGSTVGDRVNADLLLLRLSGSVSMAARSLLDARLDRLRARLLRLKLKDATITAPDAAELAALRDRTDDPLIAAVARDLADRAAAGGDDAESARIALAELFALVAREGGR